MLWLFLSILVVARSPLGKALADRIAGRIPASGNFADLEGMEHRIDERIMDLEERIEFAERLLQQRRSQQLPPID